jgi:hypothetical protein
MNYMLARKKSSLSLCGKQSEGSPTTSSDQKLREAKNAVYQSLQYRILLETKGSFIRKLDFSIIDISKTICCTLLEAEQIVLEDLLFQDDLFNEVCKMIQDKNKAKVIQDIARLIVLSAQSLAIHSINY